MSFPTPFFKRLADSEAFQTVILFLILLTAFSMGAETVPELLDEFGDVFLGLHYLTQAVFAFEIVVRLLAFAPDVRKFFKDGWNTFDFTIVALSFVPGVGSFALIGRLLRLLRVLRIFSVSDRLRGFADRLRDSLDELGFAALYTLVIGYIFLIAGHYLFVEVDPAHWGSLWRSSTSVFYLLLVQDVRDYVDPAVAASKGHLLYFVALYAVFVSLFVTIVSASIADAVGKGGKRD